MSKTFYESGRNLLKTGLKLGQMLGYNEKDPVKLIEFLKKKSAEEICKQAYSIIEEWLPVRKESFLNISRMIIIICTHNMLEICLVYIK